MLLVLNGCPTFLSVPFALLDELSLLIDNLIGSFTRFKVLALAIVFTLLFGISVGCSILLLLPTVDFTLDVLSIACALFVAMSAAPFMLYSWERFLFDQCGHGSH